MAITYEKAKEDIERYMERIPTMGPGTEKDRAAQLVLQTMDVLESRLDDPKQINLLYFKITDSSKILPSEVYNLAKDYAQGKIDEKTARQNLDSIKNQYKEVFKKMDIKPQSPKILFHKFP